MKLIYLDPQKVEHLRSVEAKEDNAWGMLFTLDTEHGKYYLGEGHNSYWYECGFILCELPELLEKKFDSKEWAGIFANKRVVATIIKLKTDIANEVRAYPDMNEEIPILKQEDAECYLAENGIPHDLDWGKELLEKCYALDDKYEIDRDSTLILRKRMGLEV